MMLAVKNSSREVKFFDCILEVIDECGVSDSHNNRIDLKATGMSFSLITRPCLIQITGQYFFQWYQPYISSELNRTRLFFYFLF